MFLVEFPYPSGAGLHVGHPRSYTALDVVIRKRRQNGYNVLYPMGWDAFGLPTENFAMKNHIHPAIVTKNNVDHFRSQLKAASSRLDGVLPLTTSMMGRPNFLANSQSRVSWAGTAMMAPVP